MDGGTYRTFYARGNQSNGIKSKNNARSHSCTKEKEIISKIVRKNPLNIRFPDLYYRLTKTSTLKKAETDTTPALEF